MSVRDKIAQIHPREFMKTVERVLTMKEASCAIKQTVPNKKQSKWAKTGRSSVSWIMGKTQIVMGVTTIRIQTLATFLRLTNNRALYKTSSKEEMARLRTTFSYLETIQISMTLFPGCTP